MNGNTVSVPDEIIPITKTSQSDLTDTITGVINETNKTINNSNIEIMADVNRYDEQDEYTTGE